MPVPTPNRRETVAERFRRIGVVCGPDHPLARKPREFQDKPLSLDDFVGNTPKQPAPEKP